MQHLYMNLSKILSNICQVYSAYAEISVGMYFLQA